MTAKVSLDKAGRVVLPSALQEKMQLGPGDTFVLESEGERITLRPVRPQALLQKGAASGSTRVSQMTPRYPI
jgi:AbrB family looped-hinge helix DNA binding protein